VRGVAYVAVGLFLILLQGTLHRVLSPLESLAVSGFQIGRFLHGATPNLALPLVVYLGLHESSIARGVTLSYCLGWGVDLLGGGPAFLFRFTMVAVFWIAHVASARVSAQSAVTRVPLAFTASLLESLIVLTLLAIFGTDSLRPREITGIVLPRAISTSFFALFVFSLAHRLRVTSAKGGSGSSAGSEA
jgi:rod shape-determining protein MreD